MFKIGDKVKCLRNYGGAYTSGNIYTVREITVWGSIGTTCDDRGVTNNGMDASFFELVAPCTVLTMDILEKTKDYSAFSQRNCTQCFNGASMQYYAQDKRYFCNVCWHVVKE
jgi:hypothetical protein